MQENFVLKWLARTRTECIVQSTKIQILTALALVIKKMMMGNAAEIVQKIFKEQFRKQSDKTNLQNLNSGSIPQLVPVYIMKGN